MDPTAPTENVFQLALIDLGRAAFDVFLNVIISLASQLFAWVFSFTGIQNFF